MSTAAVILAAGFSRRLGRPKQKVMLQGRALLQIAIDVAAEAALSPVLAVVGENWEDLQLRGTRLIRNADAAEGMASSLRVGIGALAGDASVSGAVIMACDQPLVSPTHLRALREVPDRITGSRYRGRTGVPAYFPSAAFPDLLTLQGDAGARALLTDAASVRNEDLALDIDTEEDLKEAERLLAAVNGVSRKGCEENPPPGSP